MVSTPLDQRPSLETTPIPGLVVVRLDRRDDPRGFFKENWQREKMLAIGLPDFGPVQNNVSFNGDRGVTRGIHTEPWDKFISLATGRIFGAWVDMREGDTFGTTFTLEMDTGLAIFVPRGVGNSYQVLEDATAYTYLVNEHWRAGVTYPALALDDPTAAIAWPIPLDEAIISEKDQNQPKLADVVPMAPKKTLIVGALGQLGRALHAAHPSADRVDLVAAEEDGQSGVTALDLTDAAAVAAWPWHEYAVVLNAAAYTAVDAAESTEGRVAAWGANATGPATLARLARDHRFTLVHYSSEYVFDGTAALDLADAESVAAWPWHEYAVVLNAAAYTAVDAAESTEGRVAAWGANATGPATLARLAREHAFTLVHYSSEYVFDGTAALDPGHTEDEPLSPLGVYAQSKAAGDLAVGLAPRHYLLRTSWVIGDGNNFVRTMRGLAEKGVSPSVVDDQVGRLTFAGELVRATQHLLELGADFGTYNVSNGGAAMSWREIAQAVFERSGRSASDVSGTSTQAYADGVLAQGKPFAPRPLNSAMSLAKIEATGFEPEDALVALDRYLA